MKRWLTLLLLLTCPLSEYVHGADSRTILHGDVTGSDFGNIATTITAGAVTNAKLQNPSFTIGSTAFTLGTTTTQANTRAAIGVVIGTDVQAFSSVLSTYAGIAPSANVQSLLSAADYAAMRTQLSLANVENTAISTWAGSTNITSVGTIATGTWSGTAISSNKIAAALTGHTYEGVTISGSSTPTLAVSGTTSVSGANTGDQTTVSGNAGTATVLATARNIGGASFNGSAAIGLDAISGVSSPGIIARSGTNTWAIATASDFPSFFGGFWNAATNVVTPGSAALPAATTNVNQYYTVSVGGTQTVDGHSYTVTAGQTLTSNGTTYDIGGSGNVLSTLASTTSGRLSVFSGTSGATITDSSLTGLLKATSGVPSAATAGTDYVAPGTIVVTHKGGTWTTYTASADTDSARGDAIKTAVAAMVAYDVAKAGGGTYALGNAVLALPTCSVLCGSGQDVTVITSTADEVVLGGIVCPGGGTIVEDLTIWGTLTDGTFQCCFGNYDAPTGDGFENFPHQAGTTNNICRRVKMIADADNVFLINNQLGVSTPSSAWFYECNLNAKYDAVRTGGVEGANNFLFFSGCNATSIGPSATGSGRVRTVAVGQGTCYWIGGTVTATNGGATEHTGFLVDGSNGVLWVIGAKITSTNSGAATAYDVRRTAGTLNVLSGVSGTGSGGALLTNGTITYPNQSGSGKSVLDTSPTISGPIISSATASTIAGYDGSKVLGSITTGTGVVTALGINTGSAGAFQVNNASGAGLTSLTAANISGVVSVANGGTGLSTLQSVTDAATLTPAATDYQTQFTALAQAATVAAPAGSPANGQKLIIRIKDNGTSRALTWNAIYRVFTGVTLPTATTISKTHYIGCVYNSADSKWDVLAVTVLP